MSEIDAFNFTGESIDNSLRKLLAKVHLPKEAQQIDRVVEAFAKRWYECNLGLMNSPDGAYAVAFSILLLHTDAHNKNVKNKMNKETFIMRTRLIEGGDLFPPEILDIMFDNITYSKFVYAEDDIEPGSQLLLKGTDKQSWFVVKRGKSDPSLLGPQPAITSADLCPKLDQLMPPENPYSYKGTLLTLNTQQLHRAFLIAPSLRVTGVRSRQPEVSSPTSPTPARPLSTANIIQEGASLTTPRDESYVLRIAKAGVLERKFDLAQGGKKSNVRGWRSFGVILSGSQLIFFSDVAAFLSQVEETSPQNHNGQPLPNELITPTFSVNSDDGASLVGSSSTASLRHHPTRSEAPSSPASSIPPQGLFPQPTFSTSSTSYSTISSTTPTRTALLRPFQILSLGSSVCLYDATYSKYPHAFRLVAGDGQQYMFRAESEEEMNDWIGKINYTASFKTAGIKLRGPHPGRAGPRGKGKKEEAEKREEVMKAKLQDINTEIAQQSEQLNRDIQLRRNLAVMVPLQKSTRDRIMQYAETVGHRLKTTRVLLQQLECYREILEKDLVTSQETHLRHAMTYSSYGHKNSRHLGDDSLVPKSRMFRSMSASGPEGNTIRSDDDRLNPSLMLSTPATSGNELFWTNGSGNMASPIADHGDTFDSSPSRDSVSSTARLVVPLSPSRSSALPGSPLSQEFYDPAELEARLQKQESLGRRATSTTRRRTIFMDEVNENGEPIQDASGTRRSSCPQIPPVDPGMLTSPMSLAPDLTSLEIEDREKAATHSLNHGSIHTFTGHRHSGEQSRSSSRRSSHSISDTPKSVRGVWDWAAAAAKSATTAIKGTVSVARDDSASSSPHGSPHGSRPASPAPSATATVAQMEKLLRRRSRSNPIKPSVAIISAGHVPALLGVGLDADGNTLGGRNRSNSESSFLRDDDELSVVLVDEDAGAEDDAEGKGLIVMDDEDEDGEEIEVVDLVESEEAGEAEDVAEEQGLKGEEGGGGKSGTSE